MSDLWHLATSDLEAEHTERRILAARQAAAPVWTFLAGATSRGDFENRRALVGDQLDKAAAAATNDDPNHYLATRVALEDSFLEDFEALHTERQAEAQRRNAHRAHLRRQEAEAKKRAERLARQQKRAATGDKSTCAHCGEPIESIGVVEEGSPLATGNLPMSVGEHWVHEDGSAQCTGDHWGEFATPKVARQQKKASISRADAEKVLEALKAQWGDFEANGMTGPKLVEDWNGAPFAILWEEGPYDWPFTFPNGGVNEEMASLGEEFGIGGQVKDVSGMIPSNVYVEVYAGWGAVTIYDNSTTAARAKTALDEDAIDQHVRDTINDTRCPNCGSDNYAFYSGEGANCADCGHHWWPPPPYAQPTTAGRTARRRTLHCGRCGNEWTTEAEYRIACPECGAEESVTDTANPWGSKASARRGANKMVIRRQAVAEVTLKEIDQPESGGTWPVPALYMQGGGAFWLISPTGGVYLPYGSVEEALPYVLDQIRQTATADKVTLHVHYGSSTTASRRVVAWKEGDQVEEAATGKRGYIWYKRGGDIEVRFEDRSTGYFPNGKGLRKPKDRPWTGDSHDPSMWNDMPGSTASQHQAAKPPARVAEEGAYVTQAHDSTIRKEIAPGTVARPEQGYITWMGTKVYDWEIDGLGGGWQLGGDWTEMDPISPTGARRTAGNPHPAGSPAWFDWEANPTPVEAGPTSGVPSDLFPDGIPIRGDLTPEQQAWLDKRGQRHQAVDIFNGWSAPIGEGPRTKTVSSPDRRFMADLSFNYREGSQGVFDWEARFYPYPPDGEQPVVSGWAISPGDAMGQAEKAANDYFAQRATGARRTTATVLEAQEVQVGDQINTAYGPSVVVAIDRVSEVASYGFPTSVVSLQCANGEILRFPLDATLQVVGRRQAARSDYDHWNEEADLVWYQEEGRHIEEPDPDDFYEERGWVSEDDEDDEEEDWANVPNEPVGDSYTARGDIRPVMQRRRQATRRTAARNPAEVIDKIVAYWGGPNAIRQNNADGSVHFISVAPDGVREGYTIYPPGHPVAQREDSGRPIGDYTYADFVVKPDQAAPDDWFTVTPDGVKQGWGGDIDLFSSVSPDEQRRQHFEDQRRRDQEWKQRDPQGYENWLRGD